MQILEFLKGFSPRLRQRDLEEQLRLLTGEVDKAVIPQYEAAADYFRMAKLKSKSAARMETRFYNGFDTRGRRKEANFIACIASSMKLIRGNLDYIEKAVDTLFTTDTVIEGINAKQATVTRAIASLDWASQFASDLLNYVYASETYEAMTTGKRKGTQVEGLDDPRLVKFRELDVEKGIERFGLILNDFAIETKEFEKSFVRIPECLLTSKNASAIAAHYKDRDLDPFYSPGLQGFSGNPLWSIGLAIEEWRVRRYRSKEDKLKVLQLRLLQLKTLQETNDNPALQRQIETLQERCDALDSDLREFEESVK